MNYTYTRTITTSGCGMPMMPMGMGPMMGMGGPCIHPRMSIFGFGCRPMMGYAIGGAALAGACAGAALAMPGVMNAIGSGLKWGYNNLALPVWNNVLKPAGLWTYNNILKPIGSGLQWVWDNTLGWVLRKLETAVNKKKSQKAAENAAEAANEVQE